jgi:hypothetical protein
LKTVKTQKKQIISKYDFQKRTEASLLICCAGFEVRSLAFLRRLRKNLCKIDYIVQIKYISQKVDNDANYELMKKEIARIYSNKPDIVEVDNDKPQQAFDSVRRRVINVGSKWPSGQAIIDISGMTHLLAMACLDGCVSAGLRVSVVYTEAETYYPLKSEQLKLVRAWKAQDYQTAEKYLQSTALKSVDIVPEMQGNFRPGKPLCLFVFAGYEPNRLEGLVNAYAPGALIVIYGKSPHSRTLNWRTKLSKDLHRDLFRGWLMREIETSTLNVHAVLNTLETEFQAVGFRYDVAITPHCSKMQAIALYLFWRKHPEVQIVFTSPVRFNAKHYSRGSGRTFEFPLQEYLAGQQTSSC